MEMPGLPYNIRTGGFTLIEAIPAIFVAGLTVLLVMTVFVASLNNYYRQDTHASANRSVGVGMEYIAKDLRSANAILTSYGIDSTSSTSIVMQSPAYDDSGIIDGDYDYISYKVDNQHRLLRTVVTVAGSRVNETGRTLAHNINSLTLTYTCINEFQGNGTAKTFDLAHSWIDTPSVSINGIPMTTGYGLNTSNHKIVFVSPPASGSLIEVSYAIDPSDPLAIADVEAVNVQLSSRITERGKVYTASLDTYAKLRNKK